MALGVVTISRQSDAFKGLADAISVAKATSYETYMAGHAPETGISLLKKFYRNGRNCVGS